MKDIITEQFVDELVQSDIWAKVDKADPINENRTEASVPDSTRAVDETEEISAQDFAVELFENLAPEVILEFLDIVHEELLDEHIQSGDADQLDEAMTRILSKLGGLYGHARALPRTMSAASQAAQADVAKRGERWQDVRRERGDLKTKISTDKYRRDTRKLRLRPRAKHLFGGKAKPGGTRKREQGVAARARRAAAGLGPQPLGPGGGGEGPAPVGGGGNGEKTSERKPNVPRTPPLTTRQAGVGQTRTEPRSARTRQEGGGGSSRERGGSTTFPGGGGKPGGTIKAKVRRSSPKPKPPVKKVGGPPTKPFGTGIPESRSGGSKARKILKSYKGRGPSTQR